MWMEVVEPCLCFQSIVSSHGHRDREKGLEDDYFIEQELIAFLQAWAVPLIVFSLFKLVFLLI
ncbi:hypothetical protein BU16DRAFT_215840 [Lophium mytilinum]|uniref:Uncharacterized protein n=1 Tax=Lophium mytilinum TaxID=390894 RepID=A0A6A6Q9W4_9PEZI|nr:hypothetical protein BU16DRAFT_215840 [Lophium mytilinum]